MIKESKFILPHEVSLKKKTVLIIGNEEESKPLKEKLQKAGFDVVYPMVTISGPLAAEQVKRISLEAETDMHDGMLDAIVIFKPEMKSESVLFPSDPTMQLIDAVKAVEVKNKPPIILYDPSPRKPLTFAERHLLLEDKGIIIASPDVENKTDFMPTLVRIIKHKIDAKDISLMHYIE